MIMKYNCAVCWCVCVLAQSGVDVNRVNSYEQTALEVVNKFTASRGAREIKQMLRGNIIIIIIIIMLTASAIGTII